MDRNIPTPKPKFVNHLPDLITEADYQDDPAKQKVRVQVRTTPDGVEILGDSMYAHLIEALLSDLEPDEIERMLCG